MIGPCTITNRHLLLFCRHDVHPLYVVTSQRLHTTTELQHTSLSTTLPARNDHNIRNHHVGLIITCFLLINYVARSTVLGALGLLHLELQAQRVMYTKLLHLSFMAHDMLDKLTEKSKGGRTTTEAQTSKKVTFSDREFKQLFHSVADLYLSAPLLYSSKYVDNVSRYLDSQVFKDTKYAASLLLNRLDGRSFARVFGQSQIEGVVRAQLRIKVSKALCINKVTPQPNRDTKFLFTDMAKCTLSIKDIPVDGGIDAATVTIYNAAVNLRDSIGGVGQYVPQEVSVEGLHEKADLMATMLQCVLEYMHIAHVTTTRVNKRVAYTADHLKKFQETRMELRISAMTVCTALDILYHHVLQLVHTPYEENMTTWMRFLCATLSPNQGFNVFRESCLERYPYSLLLDLLRRVEDQVLSGHIAADECAARRTTVQLALKRFEITDVQAHKRAHKDAISYLESLYLQGAYVALQRVLRYRA